MILCSVWLWFSSVQGTIGAMVVIAHEEQRERYTYDFGNIRRLSLSSPSTFATGFYMNAESLFPYQRCSMVDNPSAEPRRYWRVWTRVCWQHVSIDTYYCVCPNDRTLHTKFSFELFYSLAQPYRVKVTCWRANSFYYYVSATLDHWNVTFQPIVLLVFVVNCSILQ